MSVLDLNRFSRFYLVGIKGVAMTALAQILVDAGKIVSGCDVAEDFVTAQMLTQTNCRIDIGFDHSLPIDTECVIYTAAHHGQANPMVVKALQLHLPVASHAEALAFFLNQKRGIAVCGVGGKSTTSAMISWILSQLGQKPGYAVGVGKIAGLDRTGVWNDQSPWFVAEADEYAIDPAAPQKNEPVIPRFGFMKPQVTVCTNLQYDHPDVYRDFTHTKKTFAQFFLAIKERGKLIINRDNQDLVALVDSIQPFLDQHEVNVWGFGEHSDSSLQLLSYSAEAGLTTSEIKYKNNIYQLKLVIPGKFNVYNALAALLAAEVAGVKIEDSITALAEFRSTMRRFEYIGEKNGVRFYDDYAHHPKEVAAVIQAIQEWYPEQRVVIAFQSHTFSRTKQLFTEFVSAFAHASEVVMIDIFPSAREAFDPSVTSDQLCNAITSAHPNCQAHNYQTLEKLAAYLQTSLKPGDVCLTVGAGDIYQVHSLIKNE